FSCYVSFRSEPIDVDLTYQFALVLRDGVLKNYSGEALQLLVTDQGTSSNPNMNRLMTVDINGDGLADSVIKENDTYAVRFNNGAGFEEKQPWITLTGAQGRLPQFLDYNGDGATDIIWYDAYDGSKMKVRYWGDTENIVITGA